MPRLRRLPIATLARASGARRRGGKPRFLLFALGVIVLGGIALWYFRLRGPETEQLPMLEEPALPDGTVGPGTAPDFSGTAAPTPPSDNPQFTAPVGSSAPDITAANTSSGAPPSNLARPTRPDTEPTPPAAPDAGPVEKDFRPRLPRDVFEAQVSLMRNATCPGSIDGAWGGQTRNAVAAFQEKHGLRVTGQLDNPTRDALKLREQPLRIYTVTENDISRLRPFPKGWLARSELDFMGYSTVLEAVAERHFTHPNHLKRLNPKVDWTTVKAGTRLTVPNIGTRASPPSRPEYILISLGGKTLRLYDAENNLLAHFPCSIARRVEKRPVGELSVITVAYNPNYTFNPETFPDSPDAQQVGRKLILQPGPNNPVGVAWIALSAGDGSYGIHGSPEPEQIGRTESSGCFRLANWNAEYLLPLVRSGMLVRVEP